MARPIDLLLVHRLVPPGARWLLARHVAGERAIPGGVVRRRWIFVAVLCLGGVIPVILGCAGRIMDGEGDDAGDDVGESCRRRCPDAGACPAGADAAACPAGADAAICPAGADAAACPTGADAAACPTCPACPAGVEICDGVDNDGDGVVDEGCGAPAGWTLTWGGVAVDATSAAATAPDGSIFVGGSFQGTVDLDPGIGIDSRTAAGARDGFLTRLAADGTHAWTLVWAGADDDLVTDVAVAADGAIVVAGGFRGTVDFDPGPGTDSRTAVGTRGNLFVTRLSADGTYRWTRTIAAVAESVAVGPDGAVVVAGVFMDTVDFDPGPGADNRTTAGPYPGSDAFVTKLDAGGGYAWTRVWGQGAAASANDSAHGVAVAADGAVVVAGEFWGTVDFDPGPGTDSRTAAGQDAFVTKLDAAGGHAWTRIVAGTSTDSARGVAVGPDGAVVVVGRFAGMVDFDPGPAVDGASAPTYGASQSSFVTRLGADGAYGWTKTLLGNGSQGILRDVAIEAGGAVIVAGDIFRSSGGIEVFLSGRGVLDDTFVSTGMRGALVAKLGPAGVYEWGAVLPDGAYSVVGSGVALSGGGTVLVTGYYDGSPDFDTGPRVDRRTAAGASDAFLTKLAL